MRLNGRPVERSKRHAKVVGHGSPAGHGIQLQRLLDGEGTSGYGVEIGVAVSTHSSLQCPGEFTLRQTVLISRLQQAELVVTAKWALEDIAPEVSGLGAGPPAEQCLIPAVRRWKMQLNPGDGS